MGIRPATGNSNSRYPAALCMSAGARHGAQRGENHELKLQGPERPGHHHSHRHQARDRAAGPLKTLETDDIQVPHATIGRRHEGLGARRRKDLIVRFDARRCKACARGRLAAGLAARWTDTLRQGQRARRLVRGDSATLVPPSAATLAAESTRVVARDGP